MPVFVTVAETIAADIRRGALRAGDRLPSTRALADELGVNRNTVVAAFDELAAQGWIVARGPAGTFVSAELPERSPRRPVADPREPRGMATRPGFDVRAVPRTRTPLGP